MRVDRTLRTGRIVPGADVPLEREILAILGVLA